MTAVVTDSYGLSSSSGRKTSRDGDVTISADRFESLGERDRETERGKHEADDPLTDVTGLEVWFPNA